MYALLIKRFFSINQLTSWVNLIISDDQSLSYKGGVIAL